MRSGGKKSGVVAPLYDVLLFACLMSWQKPSPLVPAVGFKPPCLRTESAGANCVRSLLISRTLGPHRLTVGRHGRASSYWTQEPQARTGCDQGGGAASVDVARPDLALPARTGLGLQRVRFEHIRHAANTNGWGERSQEAGSCRWHCLRLETDLARDRRRVSRRCGLHLAPKGFHADACFRSLRPLCFRLHQTWRSAIAASVLLHAASESHRCVCSRLVLPNKRFPLSREWYLTALVCILFQKRPCCPTAAPKERKRFARGGLPDPEAGPSQFRRQCLHRRKLSEAVATDRLHPRHLDVGRGYKASSARSASVAGRSSSAETAFDSRGTAVRCSPSVPRRILCPFLLRTERIRLGKRRLRDMRLFHLVACRRGILFRRRNFSSSGCGDCPVVCERRKARSVDSLAA